MATTGPGSDDWAGLKMKYGELSMYPPTTGPDSGFAPLRYIGEDAPTEPYISPAPFLLFVNTDAYATGVFCSVPNPAGGYNLLGMNGLTNMFSLCKSSFEHTPPGPTLLFNASSTAKFVGENTYDGSSCYPVTVLIIPV
ncbi:hypothetical protein NM688_g5537 [Phlebia brevispora]|uniref:Uncharacterized protein n=1 Tax=Phlebia brevispora TaxID=194682 RepID=A0ACC1STY6_9APHY|nr:hypothetical protein NM688_g5537 [Phlebia brevispora]